MALLVLVGALMLSAMGVRDAGWLVLAALAVAFLISIVARYGWSSR